MDAAALFEILKATGLPVAYHHFDEAPKPPYIVYLFTNSADLYADGENYVGISDWQVELYAERKSIKDERCVEEVLKGAGITWEKRELYIESERLNQVIYDVQTI